MARRADLCLVTRSHDHPSCSWWRYDSVINQPGVADARRDGQQRWTGDRFYGAQGLRVDRGDVIDGDGDAAEVALLQDHVLHRGDQSVRLGYAFLNFAAR